MITLDSIPHRSGPFKGSKESEWVVNRDRNGHFKTWCSRFKLRPSSLTKTKMLRE